MSRRLLLSTQSQFKKILHHEPLEEVSREDRKVTREQKWSARVDFQLIKHVEGQLEVFPDFPEVKRPPHEKKKVVGGGGGWRPDMLCQGTFGKV